MLVVLYAKIVDDKDMGILLTGIYLGGVVENETEADALAQKCVVATQGGMVIPKISPLVKNDLLTTIKDMTTVYQKMADRMYESEQLTSNFVFEN